MKAVLCKEFGPPESLVVEDIASPEPGPGEVVLDVHAAAVNFPDVLIIQNKYQFKPPLPFSPGGEVAGVVAKLGDGVKNLKIGDRVIGSCGNGGFVEELAIAEAACIPIPDEMDLQTASALVLTYGTSHYGLKDRAQLKAGETLLVMGAAGGVGLAAVELGKAMGARVIAAASSPEKLEVAKQAGADDLINYSDGELKEKVKALTNGQGADVIYDPVGGPLFDQCMRCINWNGRVLVVGFVGGGIPKVPTNLALLKNCQIVGVFYGAFSGRFPADNEQNFAELTDMFAAGKLQAIVGAEYALSDYAEALNCLSQRRAVGKIVVNI